MPTTTPITADNLDAFLAAHRMVLLGFIAAWCPPCRGLAPVFDRIAAAYEEQVGVGLVDIDEQKPLGQRFEISAIPAVLVFKDAEVAERIVGLKPQDVYTASLDRLLA